ncbi:terpene synthase metal binding domain protein [Aspergillus clavatus NRRL 1]|uniref:Terpene synthase n=1 Tax=Aspergillus clavatus (strain ATCC 1007 / CBS 513.65 / DSM 816 / NCTC 3887 / NRRL 1 / QM 1276 / 107) TaxID=344612 RepID=A1CD14_ASPCL|nr:terpene synthase metal binding domain protein [Aspergillus clavatus NRRL 1]EAW12421.1 terpene synthase metal binding domain protein [Aspergillus clavatus NRRL 1]
MPSAIDTGAISTQLLLNGAIKSHSGSAWKPLIHPRADETCRENDDYFLQHWPFSSEKRRETFVNAGFGRVTCLYFPLARDDRILSACKLLTILFLIYDILEDMSLEDGEAYNAHLMPLMRGDVLPNRDIPVEFMMYDLWEEMRAASPILADGILEPTFTFMRAQTDKARLSIKELGHYLVYRERDVGKALLSALMRFTMDLELTPEEQAAMVPLDRNCSKQISVVNDMWSWEKEVRASQSGHKEGSALCSGVKVLAEATNLDIAATKRLLQAMVEEWNQVHDRLTAEQLAMGCRPAVKLYMKGLEYQMSGNELWSRTTLRYVEKEAAASA